jgi:hypothetical protein
MNDIIKIKLWVPDQPSFNKVLEQGKIKLDCGSPKKDKEGNFIVTIYTGKETAKKLTALGYRFEIDEEFGEKLNLRQEEVSKTDRFKGGKIRPRGLGIKK